MRFIHTADWHLGRVFREHRLIDDQRHVLQQFLQFVTDSRAEAVIIAGDIYDRSLPPVEAVQLFDEVLYKLVIEKKVKVFYIAGNHDSGERINFNSSILAGQGVFVRGRLQPDLAPFILEDRYGKIAFQLYPYAEPVTIKEELGLSETGDFDEMTGKLIAAGRERIPEGMRSVAVAHAFLAGGSETESERPLSVGGSANVSPKHFADFSYTALGHLHNPQKVGRENIRYSGSLLKYSFAEAAQKKSVTLVEIDGEGQIVTEQVSFSPLHDLQCIKGYFADIMNQRERYPVTNDYVNVILQDTEPVLDVHGRLKKIYPNLLGIEKTYLQDDGQQLQDKRHYQRKTEEAMFADFYEEMTKEKLSAEQREIFRQEADKVLRARREALK